MSELSALDILGKQFGKRLRGYAPFEVHEFLSQFTGSHRRRRGRSSGGAQREKKSYHA